MSPAPGSRLGPYQILAKLGEGGMGEVYRATDTNLKRTVAIKVLPAAVAADFDRLARFQREAEVLAALNHPNIAAIYGLERSGQTTALVMELVEGPTLADRLVRGPLPIAETLPIARQIAEALEAAHEQGIVHRDLKPANIKVRPDDTVKVLDFGLAKAIVPGSEDPGFRATNPTMTSPAMTQAGMILGTAAYMSPEQAKGRAVDRRADVWAFGAVLYEMVTGTRAFAGDDVSEVLASVLAREPDWTRLPADAPAITSVIRRCLERDPKQRFGDMQSVRLALGGAFSTGSPVTSVPADATRAGSAALAWTIAVVATVAAIALGIAALTRSAPGDDVIRTMILPPENAAFDFDVTQGPAVISADGQLIAFCARSANGRIQLWVRRLDSTDARPIEGTDGASFPFWSPDSRSLGFYSSSRGRIERVDLAGGPPVAIARAAYVRGANWTADNHVLYDTADGGGSIMEASIATGATRTLISGGSPRSPWPLPDGKHFLFLRRDPGRIHVASRDGGGDLPVTDATSNAIYSDGRLLFLRERALIAQPFDLSTLKPSGSPVAVARDVHRLLGDWTGVFSASATGRLVYLDGAAGSATTLAWFDGTGKKLSTVGEMGSARGVRLSPDGLSAAIGITDSEGSLDLWRIDLSTGVRNQLTFAKDAVPVTNFSTWSPDSQTLAYGVRHDSKAAIARRPAAGGAEETLFVLPDDQANMGVPRVTAWTNDRTTVLYSGSSLGGVRALSLAKGADGALRSAPLVKDLDNAINVRLSPSQRWFAYQASPGSGTVNGIFVEAYPGGGQRQQVTARGTIPVWSLDGKALYYADDNILTVVEVIDTGGALRFGPPRAVMPIIVGRGFSYDLGKDGRILALVTSEARAVRPLTLVQHWTTALKGQ